MKIKTLTLSIILAAATALLWGCGAPAEEPKAPEAAPSVSAEVDNPKFSEPEAPALPPEPEKPRLPELPAAENPLGDEWLAKAELRGTFDLYLGAEKLEKPAVLLDNRVYISTKILSEKLKKLPDKLIWPFYDMDDDRYISLVDAARELGLYASFKEDETITLFKRNASSMTPQLTEGADKACYLRLEDIMADRGINGRFTHKNLENLRFFGDCLETGTKGFYIAWIPKYVNPGLEVENDISRDFDFYNADFLFSLDCLVADGGRLGLHGLTHQSRDSVSADGFEFGKDNPYTKDEMYARFDEAARICRDLGHEYYFWEFSHYDATESQRRAAAGYFDVVYQQSTFTKDRGHMYTSTIDGHDCLWVPAPAGCVESEYDRKGILGRLNKCIGNGNLVSMFFHPNQDYPCIYTSDNGDTRTFSYDMENGILPGIINEMAEKGYTFGYF